MPTPNFEDAPDGSSSINHTGSSFTQEVQCFWEDIHPYPTNPVGHSSEFPPHPSYADGSTPAVNPLPNLNTAIGASHVATNPNRRIEARMFSQGTAPFPANAGETVRRLQTATEVNDERMRAMNPEWRLIPAAPPNPNPVGYSRDFLPSCSPPRRTATEELREALSAPPRRPNRRGEVVRKDPNAWSLREAVELCKLLEVVVPEAGFHIALTGGLLHKEGRQTNCDLLFYQIRGAEPNYEILWKYLTVAGVIRHLEDSYNGWLVRATYRGKAVDCLFPNAKKVKKAGAVKEDCYKFTPPPPQEGPVLYRTGGGVFEELAPPAPILVRHNDGVPEFDAGRLEDLGRRTGIDAAVAAARIVESAASPFISPRIPEEPPF